MENITEVNHEFIKEIKEDLEKRIMFLEKTCIECAEPLRKELKLIEELIWYIQHLEHENRVYKTDINHAVNVLHDHCKNTDLCENCIFAVSNENYGFVYCELNDVQPEDWDV